MQKVREHQQTALGERRRSSMAPGHFSPSDLTIDLPSDAHEPLLDQQCVFMFYRLKLIFF